MKYRGRHDLFAAILDAANGGAAKTKIMSKAYMSFHQCNEYINTLTENGHLENRLGTYYTTQKGFEFLRAYEITNIPIKQEVLVA